MGRVGAHLHHRFRKVGSITPLYHSDNIKFYWNHCWYCGVELFYDRGRTKLKSNSFTRDHVYPASKGGNKGVNTVPSCASCNNKKKDMTLQEFRIKRLGKDGLFYAEKREAELKVKLENKEIRPSFRTQLAMIVPPIEPAYRPPPVRCMVYRELIIATPITRLLRRLFHL